MVLNHLQPTAMSEIDSSTIYKAMTPPETVLPDGLDDLDPLGDSKFNSSVPWPGETFIIRSALSGHVITLVDGRVELGSPGGRGSIHWRCVETKGWIGFQNTVSGRYLGHDARGRLHCSADRHQGWENFCVRLRPEGGYVLLMTHFERLWHVGIKVENGVERLGKMGDGGNKGTVFEFVKVWYVDGQPECFLIYWSSLPNDTWHDFKWLYNLSVLNISMLFS